MLAERIVAPTQGTAVRPPFGFRPHSATHRRNVMHIINTAGPGGAESVCVSLIRGLDRQRWQSIAVLPMKGWLLDELARSGAKAIVDDSYGRSDLPRFVFALAAQVKRHKISLIHAHLFGPSYTASLLGLLTRIPVVCTLHGQVDVNPHETLKQLKFGLINRGASRVVFVSDSLKRFYLDMGLLRPELAAVIPNGVDLPHFQRARDPILRQSLGAGGDHFLVGAVGNVRPAKAYDVLIQAAALLKPKSAKYRFAVVGETSGGLGGKLSSLLNGLALADSFKFSGFSHDVAGAINTFDLFVISSRSEGFSIATIEAMASGLPIVATRCGGPEEIIEDGVTGVLVENGSAEAIADAIESLRTDPVRRRRLGDAARGVVRERYSLQRQIDRYEALYQECLDGSRGSLA